MQIAWKGLLYDHDSDLPCTQMVYMNWIRAHILSEKTLAQLFHCILDIEGNQGHKFILHQILIHGKNITGRSKRFYIKYGTLLQKDKWIFLYVDCIQDFFKLLEKDKSLRKRFQQNPITLGLKFMMSYSRVFSHYSFIMGEMRWYQELAKTSF